MFNVLILCGDCWQVVETFRDSQTAYRCAAAIDPTGRRAVVRRART